MKTLLNIEVEKAVRLLSEYLPISDEKTRKPILFHDIRVGVYLYEHEYSREIVLAGVLHDALEFSQITEQMLVDDFGENVAQLVRTNTKDDSIKEPNAKTIELIQRCIQNGQDALIIKAADILDSYRFYTATNNQEQIQYCERNADAIFNYIPSNFTDPVFSELKQFYNK